MEPTHWLRHTADPLLQKAAHEKIRQLQAIEDDLPGVVIVHNLVDRSVCYLCKRGREVLGVTLEEIRLSLPDYHERYFNPEDAADYTPKIIALLERNQDDEIVSFFQQVRASPAHPWQWYASSIRVFLRDRDGRPVLALNLAVPVDDKHYFSPKIERLLRENDFWRQRQSDFLLLSKREREVLRLLCLGRSSQEIAQQLHISEDTAKTHRKRIRAKLRVESNYDLLQFGQAFNLV